MLELTLNVIKAGPIEVINLRQGDYGPLTRIKVQLLNDCDLITFKDGDAISFNGTTADDHVVIDDVPDDGFIGKDYFYYDFPLAATATVGQFKNAYFKFTEAETATTTINVAVNILQAVDVSSSAATDFVSKIDSIISEGNSVIASLEAYTPSGGGGGGGSSEASLAGSYASIASSFADNASTAASNADSYRELAIDAEASASTAATNALIDADNANVYQSDALSYRNDASVYASNANSYELVGSSLVSQLSSATSSVLSVAAGLSAGVVQAQIDMASISSIASEAGDAAIAISSQSSVTSSLAVGVSDTAVDVASESIAIAEALASVETDSTAVSSMASVIASQSAVIVNQSSIIDSQALDVSNMASEVASNSSVVDSMIANGLMTANKLVPGANINGSLFDGTSDITISTGGGSEPPFPYTEIPLWNDGTARSKYLGANTKVLFVTKTVFTDVTTLQATHLSAIVDANGEFVYLKLDYGLYDLHYIVIGQGMAYKAYVLTNQVGSQDHFFYKAPYIFSDTIGQKVQITQSGAYASRQSWNINVDMLNAPTLDGTYQLSVVDGVASWVTDVAE